MNERGIEYRRGRSPDALVDLADGCAAAVLADPPYGTGSASAIYGRRRNGKVNSILGDRDLGELVACAPEVARLLAPDGVAILFCAPQHRRATENILERGGLVALASLPWDKGSPGLSYRVRYAYEDAVLAAHPGYDPWEIRPPIIAPLRYPKVVAPEHPNEKPIGLLRRYLRWACPNGGLVVDPFAGIASCALAAVAEGCDYIGVEMDPQWWPGGERRIADALNLPRAGREQESLFA